MENKNEFQVFLEQIKRYIFLSLGYWYLYVIAFALAFGYAKIKNRYAKNLYSIYTTIFIESRYYQPEVYAGGIPITPGINLENEIGKLTSYEMNYKVLKALPEFEINYYLKRKFAYDPELYKSSPIKAIFSPEGNQLYYKKIFVTVLDTQRIAVKIREKGKEIIVKFGQNIHSDNASFVIEKTEHFSSSLIGQTYYFIHQNIRDLANRYSQNLRIDLRSPNSTILWIWIETTSPYKDIDYLNKLAEYYIHQRVQKKNEIAIKTIEFVDRQLGIFEDSLKNAEKEMTAFKKTNLIAVSDQGQQINEQLKEVETQIKQLEIKKAYLKQLLVMTNSQDKELNIFPPSVVGVNDPVLENLMQKYSEALYEKATAQISIKEDKRLPVLQSINLKIEQIRQSIISYIGQSIKYTEATIKELEKQRNQLYSQLMQFPLAERKLLQLNRKFEINNNIYTFLLQRRMEAGITLASSRPDAEIIDRAIPETIRFKRKIGYINVLKTIVIALTIVVIIILIIYLIDNKIKSKTEIEHLTDIPIIGTITNNRTNTKIPVAKYPRSSITESFRALRTNLLYYMVDTPAQVILITSTVSGEGKSFIASNLAAIFATTGKKTVIIEADLRKPKSHEYFSVNSDKGIVTYLIGEHSYEEIFHKTDIENLWLIPYGDIPPNPVELIESSRMQELIKRLQEDFDYIIIDSPPVGIVTDALVLAQYSDIMLFVVRQLYTTRQSIKLLNEIKEKNKVKNLGIVINDIKNNLMYGLKYGYGYSYGYGYGFSYGYGYYEEEKYQSKSIIGKLLLQLRNKLFKKKKNE